MSVQLPCSLRSLRTEIVQSPYGDRPSHGARAGIVQCHLRHVYGLWAYDCFKFVKLLAKPNRRGHGARESVRKSHSCLLPPQGGLTERVIRAGYGLHRSIASQMWTRHYTNANPQLQVWYAVISRSKLTHMVWGCTCTTGKFLMLFFIYGVAKSLLITEISL